MKNEELEQKYFVTKQNKYLHLIFVIKELISDLNNVGWIGINVNRSSGLVEDALTDTLSDSKRYFVLAVDTDPGAKPALQAYVDAIESTYPILAQSMREQYDLESST